MSILLNKLIDFTKSSSKLYFTQRLFVNLKQFSMISSIKTSTEKPPHDTKSQSVEQKSLNVAVIGVPNAGKSTFINNIINHRVCPTSSKVHTTRKFNKAINTSGNTQLVFYDTPGLVTQKEINKYHLEQSFKSSCRHAIQHADVIAVIHDVSNSWTRRELHSTVLDNLKAYPAIPSFLILNKVDILKSKRILLELVRILSNHTLRHQGGKKKTSAITLDSAESSQSTESVPEEVKKPEVGWSNFSDVFMVSSLTGNGLHEINEYLLRQAKSRSWEFPSEKFTDEAPVDLIVESVRARLLDYLPQEIPYQLKCLIEFYCEQDKTIYASVQVICPSNRIERLICGESNGKLQQITERVTSDLVETFGKPISLTISTIAKNSAQ